MSRIETTIPVEKMGTLIRGYKPQGSQAVSAPSALGPSVNAADLNIPGAGKGISFPTNDEYIPSFPEGAEFQPPEPEEIAVNNFVNDDEGDGVDDNGIDDNNVNSNDVNGDDDNTVDNNNVNDNSVNSNDDNDNTGNTNINDTGNDADNGELSEDERSVVADLAARDREVRAHEQAHVSAGGAYIRGGASYQYETGPDDKRYAVGGEVGIDSAPVRDNPEATIAKMQTVRSAALAPAEPSAQDRAVASSAAQEEANARAELRERKAEETQRDSGGESRADNTIDITA